MKINMFLLFKMPCFMVIGIYASAIVIGFISVRQKILLFIIVPKLAITFLLI